MSETVRVIKIYVENGKLNLFLNNYFIAFILFNVFFFHAKSNNKILYEFFTITIRKNNLKKVGINTKIMFLASYVHLK